MLQQALRKRWLILIGVLVVSNASPAPMAADGQTVLSRKQVRGGDAAASFLGQRRDIPGMGSPSWGGRAFRDSPAAINGWTSATPWGPGLPDVLGDLDPIAPFDQMDSTSENLITGAAPKAPRGGKDHGFGDSAVSTRPDWVPKYAHPPTFPAESDHTTRVLRQSDDPLIPLGEREVIAKPDRLRISGNVPARGDPVASAAARFRQWWKPVADNYPVAAPADALPGGDPWPVANADKVPEHVARYMAEAEDRRETLRDAQAVNDNFKYVDGNRDGQVSRAEFETEVVIRQGKSETEAQALWDSAKGSEKAAADTPLTLKEFATLSNTGFDTVTAWNRTDLTSVISEPDMAIDRGYWGRGAACPVGRFATGARLKRQIHSEDARSDNTGLNGVQFKCDGDTTNGNLTISSAEGPDGDWTDWEDCPAGEVIYGFQIRSEHLRATGDNSAVNDLHFSCRARPETNTTKLFQGALKSGQIMLPAELTFPGGPKLGGWSAHNTCRSTNAAVCGVQVRLQIDQDEEDDMGVTDVRFYCCGVKIDCDEICSRGSMRTPSPKCNRCLQLRGAVHE